ncbi:glucose PTS transporter subunit IIA [Spiroplasma endosymbiont of Cantharis lateralis]|uniref:glucose PTS transporter subunit IIA n=1 Tax=Spiroplasma endosymbiont of Cantharis lateralis TaxID=3066277 RepID=UPI00313AC977
MEISLYSPVDGEVKNIQECNDSMFADRMLGDGIVVIPESNKFKAFFDKARVTMIFDTYHAYGFDVEGLQFLIHCGMDTVSLNGKGFSTKLKVGDKVIKNDDIFNVDLNLLKEKNILKETPIVFEINSLIDYTIKELKVGKVKQGDLLCKISYTLKEKEEQQDLKTITDPVEFFNASNKYEKGAKLINQFVGTKRNYNEVYNCMTRLRFNIKNKEKVDIEAIKKAPLVKGVVWNGPELQVVIGQDVYKLKDEIVKLNTEEHTLKASMGLNSEKETFFRKMLAMFSGIMTKIIPIMVGAGLVQAIIAILIQTGLMPNIVFKSPGPNDVLITEAGIGWIILFIVGRSTTYFMGIIIAVSAANYFKLEGLMGVALGVILCSPLLFGDGGRLGMGNDFLIFDFGTIDTGNPMLDEITKIRINTMNTKIFVIVGAIYTAKKLDTWLKRVIPVALELMFRPFIVILVVCPLSFFGYGIAWNFFETLFGALTFYLGQIPIGIGVGIFTAMWQITVIFGLHIMLGMISMLEHISNGGQSIYGIGPSISIWAQVGALIGVILITQNAKLKKEAIGMLPAGCLGITEPILYGINLPKKRPLISGVCAAFIAGAFANIMGVTQRSQSGLGVFSAIGFFSDPIYNGEGKLSPISNGLIYLVACAMSISLAILFSMLSYKERETEKTLLAKTFRKITTISLLELNLNKNDLEKMKTELKENLNLLDKETLNLIKSVEKNIQKWLKLKEKLNSLISSEEIKKDKIINKGKKLVANKKYEKAQFYIRKYNEIDNLDKINLLKMAIENQYKLINFEKLNQTIEKINKDINKNISNSKFINKAIEKDIKAIIFNNINSVQIHYGLLDNKLPDINLNAIINEKIAEKKLLKSNL